MKPFRTANLPATLLAANRSALAHHSFHPHPAAVLAPLRRVVVKRQSTGKTSKVKAAATPFFATYGLPVPVCEHQFHPVRKWRLDYAWPAQKVALEVQGGVWTQGRHTRGASLLKEWEKLNTAAGMGWRFIFCQPTELTHRSTLEAIGAAIGVVPLPERIFATHLGGPND